MVNNHSKYNVMVDIMANVAYNNLKLRILSLGYPLIRLMLVLTVLGGLLAVQFAAAQYGAGTTTTAGASISSTLCSVFDTIKNVIFILALTLMVLGGSLYAGANLTPSNLKGQFQGYGMGMILGGIVGVIIVLAAPYILGLIINSSGGIGTAYLSSASTTTSAYGGSTGSSLVSSC
jgi:hypothetical protein